MAKLKLDFTGVEAFSTCEEGEHIAKLKEIEEKEASTGADMLAAVFEVTKGNSKGARVFENFPLTDKALWKLKSFLEAVGVKADGKMMLDPDKLVGKTCIISVAHQEYNGQNRARISEYKKLESSKPAASQDDEDYEEDYEADDESDEEDDEPTPPPKKAKKPAPGSTKTPAKANTAKAPAKAADKKKPAPPPEPDDDEDDEDDDWEDA